MRSQRGWIQLAFKLCTPYHSIFSELISQKPICIMYPLFKNPKTFPTTHMIKTMERSQDPPYRGHNLYKLCLYEHTTLKGSLCFMNIPYVHSYHMQEIHCLENPPFFQNLSQKLPLLQKSLRISPPTIAVYATVWNGSSQQLCGTILHMLSHVYMYQLSNAWDPI